MIISMIAAMANNRIIGKDNDMPWHLPADLKHFKAVTFGKPVIMGRRTFESIGRLLPGRVNIIITRNVDYKVEGAIMAESPEHALSLAGDVDEVMIIGGGKIYLDFLTRADRLYLTHIDLDVEGDTQFPDYQAVADWQVVDSTSFSPDELNQYHYQFVIYNKLGLIS
jgi:dihydrofolate reductase